MENEMKSIFIVTSPLEMICAIEAREYFKIKNSKLFLRLHVDLDKKPVKFLLKESKKWNDVKILNTKSNYGLSWVLVIKELRKEKFNYLFTTVKNFASHFIFNLNYEKHYLIDDGTMTIDIIDYYKRNNSISDRIALFYNKNNVKYTLIEYIHGLFNHKFRGEYANPNFFTFFDIESLNGLSVVKNNFKWFQSVNRNTSPKEIIDDKIFIVGTILVTDKIVSQDYYISVIKSIVEKYKDKKVVYILHRRETKEQLKKMMGQIDLSFQENEFLIEIDFFIKNKVPTHIVGTVSTALFTLKKLYLEGLVVDSFLLDMNEVREDKRKGFMSIYKSQNKFIDNLYE